MKTEKFKLSELVFDHKFYPRTQVDSVHVTDMCNAELAGITFPPYVIDRNTLQVIDGFHRAKKDAKLHGLDCEVECEVRDYKTEGKMFLDAMRLNNAHGRKLTTFEKTRFELRARRDFKLNRKEIAKALGMPIAKMQAIGEGRTAMVKTSPEEQVKSKKSTVVKTEEIVLKRTIKHKAGKVLTKKQNDVNKKLTGLDQVVYVNNLLMLLENDLIDQDNVYLMKQLRKLGIVLDSFLSV